MRPLYTIAFLFFCLGLGTLPVSAQENTKISTLDFVQVVGNNKSEALFYYQNNWKKLRQKALEKNYIDSFQLMVFEEKETTPYSFILITTYANQSQFEKREEHFQSLIALQGEVKLLNTLSPKEFRKIYASKTSIAQH